MTTPDSPQAQIQTRYCDVLVAITQAGGTFAPLLFFIMTTLVRPHELHARGTRLTDGDVLLVESAVGNGDVRTRSLPLGRAAVTLLRQAGGFDALTGRATPGNEALPKTLQRHLNDAEDVGGLTSPDEFWQLAVQTLVQDVRLDPQAVLNCAGIATQTAGGVVSEVDPALRRVAAAIDDLVMRAGFELEPVWESSAA